MPGHGETWRISLACGQGCGLFFRRAASDAIRDRDRPGLSGSGASARERDELVDKSLLVDDAPLPIEDLLQLGVPRRRAGRVGLGR